MFVTRAFRSGNSQAIRIPADLAYADQSGDLRITRSGDVLTIYPVRDGFQDMIRALRTLPKPEPEIRDKMDMPDRD